MLSRIVSPPAAKPVRRTTHPIGGSAASRSLLAHWMAEARARRKAGARHPAGEWRRTVGALKATQARKRISACSCVDDAGPEDDRQHSDSEFKSPPFAKRFFSQVPSRSTPAMATKRCVLLIVQW